MHIHPYAHTQFQIVQRVHKRKERAMKNCTFFKISYIVIFINAS